MGLFLDCDRAFVGILIRCTGRFRLHPFADTVTQVQKDLGQLDSQAHPRLASNRLHLFLLGPLQVQLIYRRVKEDSPGRPRSGGYVKGLARVWREGSILFRF